MLPEMRIFWFFLLLILPLIIIDFFYLPLLLAWVSFGVFAVIGFLIFRGNLKLSYRNIDLARQYSRLESLIANLQSGVISYDENFKILGFNKAAEAIFGVKKEEVLGRVVSPEWVSESRYKILTQTVFSSLAPAIQKKSETGAYPQIVDISFVEPRLELRVSTDRLISQSGEIAGFVKIIQDRTREVELLRSKSEFITVAAHQLRTPLTAVHWIFETLRDNKSVVEADKGLVDDGLAVASQLLKIVEDLLAVSKIEEGRFGYNFQEIDLAEFLGGLLKNADVLAKKYGVSLYFDPPKEPVLLRADATKLGTALSNLIDNSIKYNVKNGEVRVKLEKLENKPYAEISVKDTGIGIVKEDLAKLFTKFYRGVNAVKFQADGSGLGLYIAKNIILRHGGEIRAESELNRGSAFYITLPTDPKLIPSKEIIYGEI